MCVHPGGEPTFTAYPALNLDEAGLGQQTNADYHGHAHVILDDVVEGHFLVGRLWPECFNQTSEVTYHSPEYHENRVQAENTAWVNAPDPTSSDAEKRRLRYACLVDCGTYAELRALPEPTAFCFYKNMVPARRTQGTLDGITHLMHLMAASMTRATDDTDGKSLVEMEEPTLPPASARTQVLARYNEIVKEHLPASKEDGTDAMARVLKQQWEATARRDDQRAREKERERARREEERLKREKEQEEKAKEKDSVKAHVGEVVYSLMMRLFGNLPDGELPAFWRTIPKCAAKDRLGQFQVLFDATARELDYELDYRVTEDLLQELLKLALYIKDWGGVSAGGAVNNLFRLGTQDTATIDKDQEMYRRLRDLGCNLSLADVKAMSDVKIHLPTNATWTIVFRVAHVLAVMVYPADFAYRKFVVKFTKAIIKKEPGFLRKYRLGGSRSHLQGGLGLFAVWTINRFIQMYFKGMIVEGESEALPSPTWLLECMEAGTDWVLDFDPKFQRKYQLANFIMAQNALLREPIKAPLTLQVPMNGLAPTRGRI